MCMSLEGRLSRMETACSLMDTRPGLKRSPTPLRVSEICVHLIVGHCVLNIDGLSQRQRASMGVGANRPVESLGVQPAVRS